MSLKKSVLKICNKFTGERPCRSAISIKLQSKFAEQNPVSLLRIFRTPFLKNTPRRLLLNISFINSFIPVEHVYSFSYVSNCIFRNLKLLSYFGTDNRSSRSEVFLVKGVLKICTKFTGEHPLLKSLFGMGVL